ncbi:MAG: acetoacetate--CoA ligase [Arenicella sp.]|nr:acetoacetate--CoA ligase [Arenicella sp.]
MSLANPIWTCTHDKLLETNLFRFRQQVNTQCNQRIESYQELHRWSVENTAEFWSQIWDFCGVTGIKGDEVFVPGRSMLESNFFPQAKLNFAENLLNNFRVNESDDALVFWGEERIKNSVSWKQLRESVSQMAQALRASGVVKGDRVVAYMPNIPETIISMLAVSSIGAIWSSCSPDFGVQGVLDRFGQVEPKILIAADGYFYNGKEIDNLDKVSQIARQLPSLEKVIVVPFLRSNTSASDSTGDVPNATFYQSYLSQFKVAEIEFEQLDFDHPLYILYSSGTTGAPKCIVHGAGGTLLQHLKEHQLHNDVKPGDRVFYFTTCTWMMWNWLVSGLASGATLLLYDGSPFHPNPTILFDFAEQQSMTHFGTSAKYIDALKNEKVNIKQSHDFSTVRVMCSTGSPLVAESFDYVYNSIKDDIYLASISGGTDIISCFVLGDPSSDLYRGEIACKGLGMAIEIWDDDGQSIVEQKGELVCTKAFPSMPIYFWNDPQNQKYHAAYFERYDGIWAQGDYAEVTDHQGVVIYGRSDATLNPGGVRIGTAEIYRQVEQIEGIQEAVVIGQSWSDDVRAVLFVVMASDQVLDDSLRSEIKLKIRQGASPRHVPAVILQVADIPRTKSGKISELAVRDVVEGRPVKNTTALANPEALDNFSNLVELS